MVVSGEHRPCDCPLPRELTCKAPSPSLKLFFIIGILSLSALSIGLLIYLYIRLSRTPKKRKMLAEPRNSEASSELCHEVFLSFRGLDTRHGFTDHLYHGMVDVGILVFRDDESLRVGKKISNELQQAIENSKIYIPIFSKNYATSHWCLEELAYMVECTSKSNGNKEILPIFLDVEPDDVKLKTKLYRKALSKHRRKFSTEAVESWEKALMEVDEIKGWNLKKDEGQGDLIRLIIRRLRLQLKVTYENVTEHLVGVDDHVEDIIKMLDTGSTSVRFLRIHGMGGVGKTTLAKVVFNTLSSSFDQCCFLEDVRESSKGHNGIVNLQEQLLSKLIGSHSIGPFYHMNDGINLMNKGVLRKKKVLIVLDDVDEKKQLKYLVGKGNWFGSGSRIIITTRNQSVLMIEEEATSQDPGKKSTIVLTYELREMEFGHALKLFSKHAFRRDSPPDDRVSLSENIVRTLGNLPLALVVTGSSLIGKSEAIWVDRLKKLKEAPPKEVQRKLMTTYETLDHEQKQVFLDIAYFFVNRDRTYPIYMWKACGYCPHDALDALILLSLIKVKEDNTFWMHDQVRDLGKEIVRQENYNDPFERSRVCNPKEAKRILKRKQGNGKIEALSLEEYCPRVHRIGRRSHRVYHARYPPYEENILKHDKLANLPKLRYLQADEMFLVGDFENLLPDLIWLSWNRCHPKFEATSFHPTNLVVLDLSESKISEQWNGWNQIRQASKLKVLDLSSCQGLRRTPDLSKWVFLERLILEGCENLTEIDPSIGQLKRLTSLNLGGCKSLQELPEEIGCLQALIEIVMPSLLPKAGKVFESLLRLSGEEIRIKKLPYSIGGLVNIRELNLSGSSYIEELPDSIGNLRSLVELDLSWTSIELLDSIGNLRSLVKLDLSGTSIGHLPDSIGNLKQLKVLRMSYSEMTKLSRAIGLMEKLEELDAEECDKLTGDIPEEIGGLSRLRILRLSYTHISGLPTTVSCLSNLQMLDLESCPELKQLPELPTSLTFLRWSAHGERDSCVGLANHKPETLVHAPPTSIGTLSQLETLTLTCGYAQFLPWLPSSLRELRLEHLETPRSLDFSNLKNLSRLSFNECSMQEISGMFDAELETLIMRNCKIEKPDTLFQLEMKRLRYVHMKSCAFLPEVLDLSRMKNLEYVILSGCNSLVEIYGLGELGSLSTLSVKHCRSLEIMSSLSKLKKLVILKVKRCPKLRRSIEGLSHLESLLELEIIDAGELGEVDVSNLNLNSCRIE